MEFDRAKNIIRRELQLYGDPSAKVNRYIGKFYQRHVKREQISAKVQGNHGEYAVSLKLDEQRVQFSCSCYIGKYGCHHCVALAHTFLKDSASFIVINEIRRSEIKTVEQVGKYLDYVTFGELLAELKSLGISQKEFAQSIGTSSQYLSAVKASEARNRFYKGLGAAKLACLWMIEHAGKLEIEAKKAKPIGKTAKKLCSK